MPSPWPPATVGLTGSRRPLPSRNVSSGAPRAARPTRPPRGCCSRSPPGRDQRRFLSSALSQRHPPPGWTSGSLGAAPAWQRGAGLRSVDAYARALEEVGIAFSLNPSVFFRLSRPAALAGSAVVHFVDITAGTPEYGGAVPHRVSAAQRGRYFCGAGLVVQPDAWSPLQPGHRYAVVLTDCPHRRRRQPVSARPRPDGAAGPGDAGRRGAAGGLGALRSLRSWLHRRASQ